MAALSRKRITWFQASCDSVQPSAMVAIAHRAFKARSGLVLFARFGFGRLGSVLCLIRFLSFAGLGHQTPALADPGLASHLAAQVVQPSLADVAVTQDVDLVDARRVDHEGPLDAHAVRYTPHREIAPQAAARDADDRSLEHLDAFARALDDLGVHSHRVACTQRRRLLFLLLLLELLDHVHVFFNSLECATRLCAACCRRHCLMRAWSPDSRPSGRVIPRSSAGLVTCGQPPDTSSAKPPCPNASCASEPG